MAGFGRNSNAAMAAADASSASLARVRASERRPALASKPGGQALIIGRQLGLPPPETS